MTASSTDRWRVWRAIGDPKDFGCWFGFRFDERSGRERLRSVETARLAEARGYLYRISQQGDATIERLRAFVETDG